jgi:2'-5' RNA ligase
VNIADLLLGRDEVAKAQRSFAAESRAIRSNRRTVGKGPHDFKAARWTTRAGQPRCLHCGSGPRTDSAGKTLPCKGIASEEDTMAKNDVIDPAPAALAHLVLEESMLPPAFVAKGVSPLPTGDGLTEADEDDDEEDQDDADFAEPTGAMIAFGLPEDIAGQLAVDGGVPAEELHVTLAYLGEADELGDVTNLLAAVTGYSVEAVPVAASVTGFAIFIGDDETDCVAVALLDAPNLGRWREDLCRQLSMEGVSWSREHGFIPHITLAFGSYDELRALPMPDKTPVTFTHMAIAVAGNVQQFPLLGARWMGGDSGPFSDEPYAMSAVAKADEEQRYTLAPLYAPELDDSHGEHVGALDLQKAVHEYVRNFATSPGGRDIRLQHMPETRAGECVEIVTWPFEVKCALRKGDGTVTEVTMPPGTVYQGVVWEEWAWPMVKSGELGGMSMGGTAVKEQV